MVELKGTCRGVMFSLVGRDRGVVTRDKPQNPSGPESSASTYSGLSGSSRLLLGNGSLGRLVRPTRNYQLMVTMMSI